jgi:hypothetical protein
MRHVDRSEILDYATYGDVRDKIRAEALAIKASRRAHLGDLTFLFETTETVRYQVLEMVRTERLVRESEIQHELETYNELLGEKGELGATLLIEIVDPQVRDEKLRAWLTLPQHLYLLLADGTKVRPRFDPRQVGEDRLSSVQFLKFAIGAGVPVGLGADHPGLRNETRFSAETAAALLSDLTR